MTKNLDHLRPQIDVLRFCKNRKAELKALEDTARAAVEAALGDDEEGTLDGEPAIRWPTFKQHVLDQKALKDDHPEIIEDFMTTIVKRRFSVLDES